MINEYNNEFISEYSWKNYKPEYNRYDYNRNMHSYLSNRINNNNEFKFEHKNILGSYGKKEYRKNLFGSDVVLQRPGNKNNLLCGIQYSVDDESYLSFCQNIAECEEPKHYVCPTNEDMEIEKPILTTPLIYRKPAVPDNKPQESYAYMIYRALESCSEGKMTLADIYSWIEQTYPYYKTADPVWKNSIRHNLSLNSAFKKIARPESSKGKGGFWAIDYENQKNGKTLKRRRTIKTYENCYNTRYFSGNPNSLIF